MSTYTNTNDEDVVYIPGDFKLNVNMPAIDELHMEDVDFTCTFYTDIRKKKTLEKSDMIKYDADNYVAPLASTDLGKGTVVVEYAAEIPDEDFDGNIRKEVVVVYTKLKIK